MSATSTTTRGAAVAVLVTLACGWCAREVSNLRATMEAGTGKMHLTDESGRFQLVKSRPVCENCGGPLFVEDYRVERGKDAPIDEAELGSLAA